MTRTGVEKDLGAVESGGIEFDEGWDDARVPVDRPVEIAVGSPFGPEREESVFVDDEVAERGSMPGEIERQVDR
jgi:hypothetical protein